MNTCYRPAIKIDGFGVQVEIVGSGSVVHHCYVIEGCRLISCSRAFDVVGSSRQAQGIMTSKRCLVSYGTKIGVQCRNPGVAYGNLGHGIPDKSLQLADKSADGYLDRIAMA